jgi:hypothetical protein
VINNNINTNLLVAIAGVLSERFLRIKLLLLLLLLLLGVLTPEGEL